MADNAQKRNIVNHALAILNAGRTSDASVLITSIDDTEFASWSTVSVTLPDKRLACFLYERILKQLLREIQPQFACEYADLGTAHKVNQEFGGWDYLFELPTDYLHLVKQCAEGRPELGYECEVLHFRDYSHVVVGDDDQSYYCSTAHTSVDNSSDGQPPTDDGDGNWTLYNTDGGYGATWVESTAYKTGRTASMLATNDLTNEDGDAAYIKYIAYVQGEVDRFLAE
jgi:hypothetical protein